MPNFDADMMSIGCINIITLSRRFIGPPLHVVSLLAFKEDWLYYLVASPTPHHRSTVSLNVPSAQFVQYPNNKNNGNNNNNNNDLSPSWLTVTPGSHNCLLYQDGGTATVVPRVYLLCNKGPLVHINANTDLARIRSSRVWPSRLQSTFHVPGGLDLPYVFVLPVGFRTSRKYNVIVSVYAGPQSQAIMKRYSGVGLEEYWAGLGFIVASCDGVGTVILIVFCLFVVVFCLCLA
jgi:hypothetical protein